MTQPFNCFIKKGNAFEIYGPEINFWQKQTKDTVHLVLDWLDQEGDIRWRSVENFKFCYSN